MHSERSRKLLRALPIMSALLTIAACSDPKLTVMNRSSGEVGYGSVQNSFTGNSGPMSFAFANETYTGTWVAVSDPGSVSFGLLNAYSSTGQTAFGNATAYSMSTGGFATGLMTSSKGNTARCEMRYDSWAMTAAGVCRRQDGVIFDVQMAAQ
ncbi:MULTISPECIES: hypothetical protein [unclassified Aliiroseovarius]|uniref:hypothetical protein n=2 Tax=unclassified Aliiroseovarius TaxID=2623558 RepID=UPI001568B8F4|nr:MULTISPECIES: hypothetical protein [unclassified Aliiroseovarius]